MRSQRPEFRILAIAAVLLVGCGRADTPPSALVATPVPSPSVTVSASRHYVIESSADEASTTQAGAAADALFDAYAGFFGDPADLNGRPRFKLRLYATRAEFQANNRSRPWAEAYYHRGVCHAHLDTTRPNPAHYLLHEAVHQLNRELTGYAKEKWINEGLATYFGSSRYADGRLEPGVLDLDTYPLWWLARWELSGDWALDVEAQRVIPLRALITGQGGPPLDATVNAHYLGYWSLSHFLLHHEGGRHAAGFRQLARQGGSLADFERKIGPVAEIEREWYGYLQKMVDRQQTH